MKRGLQSVFSVAQSVYGQAEFHRAAAALWRDAQGNRKPYLSWAEWDRYWDLAHEHGLTEGYETASGEWVARYPQTIRNMALQRRRIADARAKGETPWQFAMSEGYRIEREDREEAERQKRYAEERKQTFRASTPRKLRARAAGEAI